MALWSGKAVTDTPLRGPPVVMDFFDTLQAAGLTVLQHHAADGLDTAGRERSAARATRSSHRARCDILRFRLVHISQCEG